MGGDIFCPPLGRPIAPNQDYLVVGPELGLKAVNKGCQFLRSTQVRYYNRNLVLEEWVAVKINQVFFFINVMPFVKCPYLMGRGMETV